VVEALQREMPRLGLRPCIPSLPIVTKKYKKVPAVYSQAPPPPPQARPQREVRRARRAEEGVGGSDARAESVAGRRRKDAADTTACFLSLPPVRHRNHYNYITTSDGLLPTVPSLRARRPPRPRRARLRRRRSAPRPRRSRVVPRAVPRAVPPRRRRRRRTNLGPLSLPSADGASAARGGGRGGGAARAAAASRDDGRRDPAEARLARRRRRRSALARRLRDAALPLASCGCRLAPVPRVR